MSALGRRIASRYLIEERLGRGGMGTVWAARDELLQRDVAVKEVVPAAHLDDEQREVLRQRTLREARAAARISSESAVTVYDVVTEDGRPWIVMERLVPRSLADVLAERGRLEPQEVARIGLAVLDALDAAHAAGVLHRDVKPGNVMMQEAAGNGDGNGRVVLSDFGIARLDEDTSVTSTGMVLGSPSYVAPERARGEPATAASDLWGLGATLWASVEGQPPFSAEGALPTLAAIVSEPLPEPRHAGPLAPVLDGLLRKDPAARLDAATARAGLLRVADGVDQPAPAPAPTPAPPAAAPSQAPSEAPSEAPSGRRGLLAALAVLLALAVVALLVVVRPWDAGNEVAGSRPDPAASGTPSGTPSASSPPAPSPSGTPEPSAPPSSPATEGAGAGVPAGFRRHVDETGFSVAVPEGWTAERDGPRVRFQDPESGSYLMVDQTDDPAPDPVEDWRQHEKSVSQRLPGYQRIRIEPVDYRGWDAADWEFLHGDGQSVHVLNRNVITAPDQAYALYWSVPSSQWEERRDTFDVVASSFTPAQ